MVVQHNLTAMNANRYLGINNSKLSKSLEKLSSGYAINRAGDNAAGLAVSEKMRSQIAGMTQGVKNAQDGISMVQTFEGALTETDSILQRMKTLANQSANGTYQDDVDRDAIQLEFDQLNDELNQIADTDFNGVIALNGGQMADGLKEVDGKFDYSNKAEQLSAANAAALVKAQAEADDKIAAAKADVDAAQTALDALGAEDISLGGNGANWNTVDDSSYTKADADIIWQKLSITDDSTTSGNAKVDEVNTVSVTFKRKDDGTWEIRDGVDNAGNTYTKTVLDTAFDAANREDGSNKGLGGFEVTITGGNKVNAIFNNKDAKEGDTVTIDFKNAPEGIFAPSNAGFKDDSVSYLPDGGTAGTDDVGPTELTVTGTPGVEIKVTDAQMTKDINDLLTNIFGSETNGKLEVNYSKKDGAVGSSNGTANTAIVAADIKLGGVNIGDKATAGKATIGGKDYWIAYADNKITVSTVDSSTGTDAAGTALFEISLPSNVAKKDGKFGKFTMSGVLKADIHDYKLATGIDVAAGKDKTLNNSVELQAAKDLLNAKKKVYDAAVAAKPQTADDLFKGVSVSDAYDNAAIPMTYTKDITLQAGARSKDAVKFTFNYTSGGLGNLEANMNCSAREGGLNTQNLSLKTAKDANAAIDQIDHAINKVSMVRGTFGAIQNRLEHKIDNLNVSIENLTSAESQIRDTNMPTEMMNFTKQQILAQASQSMLAQANQLPQGVLSLLQ